MLWNIVLMSSFCMVYSCQYCNSLFEYQLQRFVLGSRENYGIISVEISPSRRSGLLWLNVLFAGNWGWRHSGYWVTEAHMFVSAGYQVTVALMEMEEWTNYQRNPRSRHRPTGKCPLNRFEATGQLLHSAVSSNQMGCTYTRPRSLPHETNSGTTKEIPALNQSWRGCDHNKIRLE